MGLDYIRSATGRPWRKRWAGGLDRLKTPSLLDACLSQEESVMTASFRDGFHPNAGDIYIAQIIDGNLVLFDGLRTVGLVKNAPERVMQALAAGCGHAEALVQRVGMFGDTAEIKLR